MRHSGPWGKATPTLNVVLFARRPGVEFLHGGGVVATHARRTP